MEFRAIARYKRVSPQKARLVLDLIKGQRVEDARNALLFTKKRVAATVGKLLQSAIDNANFLSTEKNIDVDLPRDMDAFCDSVGLLLERGLAASPDLAVLERRRLHQVNRERDVFSRGAHPAAVALTVIKPDALAEPTLGHAGTDLVDDARAITVRDHPGILHRRRAASPVGVRRVDAGRFQPHPDFTVPGFRRRQLAAH